MKKITIKHVYIHYPFCRRKCPYCSFYSIPFHLGLEAEYIRSLQDEIIATSNYFSVVPHTLYFGGGTPSIMSVSRLGELLNNFDLNNSTEITMEINPYAINDDYLEKLRQLPVNRISLGAQSFIDKELILLGRLHTADQTEEVFRKLRESGYDNLSLDLIYGLPDQTWDDVNYSINKIIDLNPDHISTYLLSLAPENPLYKIKNQIPEDPILADFYFKIRLKLLEAGYRQYEISNFAREKRESMHNNCYWEDKYYLGLGPSASGYLPGYRYTNPESLQEYKRMISRGKIMANKERVDPATHEKEYIMLRLRTAEGLDTERYKIKFNIDFTKKYQNLIDKYFKLDFLEINNNVIRLKPEAYFVSNEILNGFM